MRTLVELNHDYSDRLGQPEFLAFLARYLRSGSKEGAENLRRFGCRVIGMRHHADRFIIDADADGFPPTYLKAAASVDRSGEAGETRRGSTEGESAVPKGDAHV